MIPPWIEIALAEIGQKEIPGTSSNSRISAYLTTVGLPSNDDIPWCSAFVNWVFKMLYIQGTDKANAQSWLKWGVESKPVLGSVVVFKRGDKAWMGHVGFILDYYSGKYTIIGGNQNDRVGINVYTSKVLGVRYPILNSNGTIERL